MARPNARVETAIELGMNHIARMEDARRDVVALVPHLAKADAKVLTAAEIARHLEDLVDARLAGEPTHVDWVALRADLQRIEGCCDAADCHLREGHSCLRRIVGRIKRLVERERELLRLTIHLGSYERAEQAVAS
jgi:hypothetical protein